jgi:hypothetical protein
LIARAQKICDCCRKPVAEKVGFCNWKLIRGYLTVRMKDAVSGIDPVDGLPCITDTTTDLHYCKQCWNTAIKNISDRSEAVTPYD